MVEPVQTVLAVHACSADSSGRDLRGFMRVKVKHNKGAPRKLLRVKPDSARSGQLDITSGNSYYLSHIGGTMEQQIIQQKVLAFKKIHADFSDIIKHDRCRYCSCFHGDVLDKVYDSLKRFNESYPEHSLNDIQADFEGWTKDLDQFKMHG